MAKFQVIEARRWHCGQMARLLRAEHRNAIALVGVDAHREIRASFDESYFRRAWLIDGELAGLGGVRGSLASPYGFVWLALSSAALKYPVQIVKEAHWQMRFILRTKAQLATTLIEGDEAAKRFAVFMGFCVEETGPGSKADTRFGRRSLMRYLDADGEHRAPFGSGSVLTVGYSAEAA